MTFSIGADPEIFVKKNGKAISVHETGLPGTKKEPFKTEYGAVQQDGLAAEFNINPTSLNDFEGFNQNIIRTIADLREKTGGCGLAIQPVMDFDPAYLKSLPDEVLELGCDPDYNAYTLAPNPRPDGEVSFRTAAGHIHVGWGADIPVDNPEHMEICANFVKMLDATVGMYMTFIDRDPRRRTLYGKAGAMRMKPYGVEYRTPSNLWIKNRDRRLLMHTLVKTAVNECTVGHSAAFVARLTEEEIITVINEGDYERGQYILDHWLIGSHGAPGLAWTNIKRDIEKELVNVED